MAFLRQAVSAACFGFIFALMMIQFSGAEHAKTTWFTWVFSFGGVATAFILLLVSRVVKGSWDPFFAWRLIPLPLIIAFFPFDPGSVFSLVFAFSASTLALFGFITLLPLVIWQSSQILRLRFLYSSAWMVFGLLLGAGLGCLVALFVELLGLKTSYFINVSAIVSIALSLLATNMILTRGALIRSWNTTLLFGEATTDTRETDVLKSRISAVGVHFGLTKREEDVLGILAQGHSLVRVQQELFISEGTAITHRRKIYQKLNIHSKAELIDLVANTADSDMSEANDD
jgi:DNA-binding CsgD family transcriptional regulator